MELYPDKAYSHPTLNISIIYLFRTYKFFDFIFNEPERYPRFEPANPPLKDREGHRDIN